MSRAGENRVRCHLTPRPEVRALRPRLAIWKLDQVLSYVTKRNERLTAVHAHRLEIFHLLSMPEGLSRLLQGSPARHERPQG
jgi:hypothetical protein